MWVISTWNLMHLMMYCQYIFKICILSAIIGIIAYSKYWKVEVVVVGLLNINCNFSAGRCCMIMHYKRVILKEKSSCCLITLYLSNLVLFHPIFTLISLFWSLVEQFLPSLLFSWPLCSSYKYNFFLLHEVILWDLLPF